MDVTRWGALIQCHVPEAPRGSVQEGDTVRIEIALPHGPAERRCFRGRAKVVRLEPAVGGLLRLAVEFSRLQFAPWRPKPEAGAGDAGAGRMEAAV